DRSNKYIEPSRVAAGPGETGHEPQLDRINSSDEDERNSLGSRFDCKRGDGSTESSNHRDLSAYQISSHGREPLISIFRPAILDRNGLIFDVAGLRQSLPEPSNIGRGFARRATAKKPDHRHGRPLRARRKRPRDRRAAEERDELAPFHSITSSARCWSN